MKNPIALALLALLLGSAKPSSPAANLPVLSITANTTATAANHVVISRGGNITLTLPNPASNTGLTFVVANHGTGVLTISPAILAGNTETLSGLTYNLGGNLATVISDGTNYRLIGQ